MYPEVRPKFVAFLEVEMELNLAEKSTLQQTCVSYPITWLLRAFRWKETGRVKSVEPVDKKWCLLVCYEFPLD